MKKLAAYTLIELVIAIALTAVVFSFLGVFISTPIRGYVDVSTRAELVEKAELALRRMERDIRQAVPNSIRVSGNQAIEMYRILEGFRYRAKGPGLATDILDFLAADTEFNIFRTIPASIGLGARSDLRLVIYNVGENNGGSNSPTAGANVWALAFAAGPFPPAGSHVITPLGNSITFGNNGAEGHITLAVAHQFAFSSPRQRIYVVDTPISYLCDTSAQTIRRFSGYTPSVSQATTPGGFSGGQDDLLTNQVTACDIRYDPGTATRSGLVTIAITISDGSEQIRLLQQIGVNNAP